MLLLIHSSISLSIPLIQRFRNSKSRVLSMLSHRCELNFVEFLSSFKIYIIFIEPTKINIYYIYTNNNDKMAEIYADIVFSLLWRYVRRMHGIHDQAPNAKSTGGGKRDRKCFKIDSRIFTYERTDPNDSQQYRRNRRTDFLYRSRWIKRGSKNRWSQCHCMRERRYYLDRYFFLRYF